MLRHIFFRNRQIELEIDMKSPNDRLAKICTNCSGHMTKIHYALIWLNPLNSLEPRVNDLWTWYVALQMWAIPGLHQ